MFHKARVIVAALALVATAAPVLAVDRDHDRERKCEQNIHKAEAKLQDAIRKHGERSRQAEKRRHELEEARERCHRH
jgi:hypothetical protein